MFLRSILSLFLVAVATMVTAQQPRLVLPIGHTSSITMACFSPDGKYIATASKDNTAKLWMAQTGMLLTEYRGHKKEVNCVAFSPDGSKLITGSEDQSARIWSVKDGSLLFNLAKHTAAVLTVSFSADGKTVITGSMDRTRKTWSTEDGSLVKDTAWGIKWDWHPPVRDMYAGNSIKIIADSIIRITNTESGQKIHDYGTPGYNITKSFYSPDGNMILAQCYKAEEKKILLLDIASGTWLPESFQGDQPVFSPDSKKIITINDGCFLCGQFECRVWSVQTGELVSVLRGYTSMLKNNPVFTPDGKRIITVNYDSSISVWMNEQAGLLPAVYGKTALQNGTPLNKDGSMMLTGGANNLDLKILDLAKGVSIKTIAGKSPEAEPVQRDFDDKRVWKNPQEMMQYMFKGLATGDPVTEALLSPDATRILTASERLNAARLWDAGSGKIIQEYFIGDGHPKLFFSRDGKFFLLTEQFGTVLFCESQTGKIIASLREPFYHHPNSLKQEKQNLEKQASQMSAEKYNELLAALESKYNNNAQENLERACVTAAAFSPDETRIVTTAINGAIKIWSAKNGSLLYYAANPDYRGAGFNAWVNQVQFSPDSKKIATASWDSTVKLWDTGTGKLIASIKDHHAVVNSVIFNPDGKEMMSLADTGALRIWSAINGKFIAAMSRPYLGIYSAAYSSDGKKIITTSSDNSISVWDDSTHALQYSFFQVDSSDYMYILPSGYYKATGSVTRKLHYVTNELSVMTFEQLDVKYNRPDKVLQATGCKDTALIDSYRKAYYKRIKKLGIDSTAFRDGYSIPMADFVNRDSIEAEQKNSSINLHINATDSIYKLDRFNCWVNEVPLFGMKGINIRSRAMNHFDTTITVYLSEGDNRIETSVTNVNGIESYRKPLLLKNIRENTEPGKVYFIGIGINRFADSSHNLKWCEQDIKDLTYAMKLKYGNRLVIVDTLYNEKATRTNIRSLKQKLMHTDVNDKVVISYSGHGLFSKEYDYYLSSYTVNFSDPEEGGIPYDEIENMLDSIPARKKILLLDACNSGEVDKEEMQKIKTASHSLTVNNTTASTRGVIVTSLADQSARLGLQNSFDLMQSLFVNVGKGTGAIIIAAATGVQFAQERSELGHGVFTYSVMEAMKKYPAIKVSELSKYIGNRVVQLTNGLQKPTMRNESIAIDWEVW